MSVGMVVGRASQVMMESKRGVALGHMGDGRAIAESMHGVSGGPMGHGVGVRHARQGG